MGLSHSVDNYTASVCKVVVLSLSLFRSVCASSYHRADDRICECLLVRLRLRAHASQADSLQRAEIRPPRWYLRRTGKICVPVGGNSFFARKQNARYESVDQRKFGLLDDVDGEDTAVAKETTFNQHDESRKVKSFVGERASADEQGTLSKPGVGVPKRITFQPVLNSSQFVIITHIVRAACNVDAIRSKYRGVRYTDG